MIGTRPHRGLLRLQPKFLLQIRDGDWANYDNSIKRASILCPLLSALRNRYGLEGNVVVFLAGQTLSLVLEHLEGTN